MANIIRPVLATCLGLGVLTTLNAGCAYHHDREQVDIVDTQGYHHKGYYDENHSWHGGWTDEHSQFHADPQDWHH